MSRLFALVLAGGRASRMGGGQKGLLPLGNKPLLAHILARLEGQTAGILLNVAEEAPYAPFALPMVRDGVTGFAGPLAGVLAGLDHLAACHPQARTLLTCSCDAPFIPRDLAARLEAAGPDLIAFAVSRDREHPTHALWPLTLRQPLREKLEQGERAMLAVMTGLGAKPVPFDTEPVDPFFNVNTPEDLAKAREWVTLAP